MKEPLEWIEDELERIHRDNLFRVLTEVESGQSAEVVIGGERHILLSSNSYLGLTTDPAVKSAAIAALEKYGTGSGGSRLVSGSSDLHRELEERIAGFKSAEAAILFSSGYLANVGTIAALVGPGDLVLSDELNHASIIDGCRMSRAEVRVYRHLDVEHLDSLLRYTGAFGKKLIVTDTVFSMDGDLAPLGEIADAADRWGAMLMIDEAHATGVLGERGSGATEHFGVEDRVPIVMGTLSKAVGSLGGYVAGSRNLIDYIRNRARTYIFDTSLPPACLAASLAAIEIIEREPERRRNLWRLIEKLKSGVEGCGLKTLPSHSAIVPVLIGEAEPALRFAKLLRSKGVFAPAVRPPSVPRGMCRIRATVMATHTDEQIARALRAFVWAKEQLSL